MKRSWILRCSAMMLFVIAAGTGFSQADSTEAVSDMEAAQLFGGATCESGTTAAFYYCGGTDDCPLEVRSPGAMGMGTGSFKNEEPRLLCGAASMCGSIPNIVHCIN